MPHIRSRSVSPTDSTVATIAKDDPPTYNELYRSSNISTIYTTPKQSNISNANGITNDTNSNTSNDLNSNDDNFRVTSPPPPPYQNTVIS